MGHSSLVSTNRGLVPARVWTWEISTHETKWTTSGFDSETVTMQRRFLFLAPYISRLGEYEHIELLSVLTSSLSISRKNGSHENVTILVKAAEAECFYITCCYSPSRVEMSL
jgi:hypothetical protein